MDGVAGASINRVATYIRRYRGETAVGRASISIAVGTFTKHTAMDHCVADGQREIGVVFYGGGDVRAANGDCGGAVCIVGSGCVGPGGTQRVGLRGMAQRRMWG